MRLMIVVAIVTEFSSLVIYMEACPWAQRQNVTLYSACNGIHIVNLGPSNGPLFGPLRFDECPIDFEFLLPNGDEIDC